MKNLFLSFCLLIVLVANASAQCSSPSPFASGITNVSADISWNTVAGAVGYEYSVTSGTTPPTSGTPTMLTSQTVGSLSPGVTYYVYVRADCGSSFSPWGSYSFTTVTDCQTPTVTITDITSSSAKINWGTITAANSYEYVVDMNAIPPSGAGTNIVALTYTATGLTPGTLHYAHVRSKCSASQSIWATASFFTLSPAGIIAVPNDNLVALYPNPATDYITIRSATIIKEVQVFNVLGVMVASQSIDSKNGRIITALMPPGTYMMKLTTEDGYINKRFSVTR